MTESNASVGYSIGEVARRLGVSTKALRYWDNQGLLVPEWRTWSDYRLYSEADLRRGSAIVLYRSTGMSLGDIATLLDGTGESHVIEALHAHRAALEQQRDTLQQQLDSVSELITLAERNDDTMSHLEKYFGENMPAYQQEAEERWGDTPEWEQSQQVIADMGEEDWARIKQEQERFAHDLATALEAGVAPGSEEALELVERHRASVSQWYDCSRSRQLILARMYTHDQRFSQAYGGHEDYLAQLVETQAAREGISDPQWDD